MKTNLILATDSYKLNHWHQYPQDTEAVYSYFEAREGAKYDSTVFFGLQYIIKRYLAGQVVSFEDVSEARELAAAHFGSNDLFNYRGWSHIVADHGGRLPLRIRAVPEGTPVPVGNVMMTVENACPECYWLTNAMESLLTHVWYPSTVATLSRETLGMIGRWLDETALSRDGLQFKLHDFGYRGASSHETAALGGCAHLVNGLGTDTLPAMLLARDYYGAPLDGLAYSVPATEHSVMTAEGREGEQEIVARLLREYPTGILSIVADSYDIYGFVQRLGTVHKDAVMARDGKVVVRPDSVTPQHPTPEALTAALMDQMYHLFGGHANSKGYRVLDEHVGMLWGDGIDPEGINRILAELALHSFSAENMVFGMGGGLLQKVNRDTQRFAFKASAIKRSGVWHDVCKDPLDSSKHSKKGRLALAEMDDGSFRTVREDLADGRDYLQTVFEDGVLVADMPFHEVRERATYDHRPLVTA